MYPEGVANGFGDDVMIIAYDVTESDQTLFTCLAWELSGGLTNNFTYILLGKKCCARYAYSQFYTGQHFTLQGWEGQRANRSK